jgi:hypothetical protein
MLYIRNLEAIQQACLPVFHSAWDLGLGDLEADCGLELSGCSTGAPACDISVWLLGFLSSMVVPSRRQHPRDQVEAALFYNLTSKVT